MMKVTPERMAEIIKNEKEIRDMAATPPPIPWFGRIHLAWLSWGIRRQEKSIRRQLRQLPFALLLLCGAAQACEDKPLHPDSDC